MGNTTGEQQYPDILTDLVEELGISTLPKERQEELVLKMSEVLLKKMFVETMEALDEKGREEYSQMMDSDATPEQVEEFFKQRISDYDAMVQKVVEEFKAEMREAGNM